MPWPNLLNMFKGKAGGAQMSPAQQRVDMYRDKGWAPDDTIDKKLWDAQPGVPGGIGPPAPEKQAMFGQMGDPRKAMGSVWEQLQKRGQGLGEHIQKGGQSLGKGLKQFGSDWKSNYENALKEQGLWEGVDNTNPYPGATPESKTYDEQIGPGLLPGEENYIKEAQSSNAQGPPVSGNPDDVLYGASKNIFGGATEPITRDSIDEISKDFVMGGIGGGGGKSLGKMWSNIMNWIK